MASLLLSLLVIDLQGFLDILRSGEAEQQLMGLPELAVVLDLDFGHSDLFLDYLGTRPDVDQVIENVLELIFVVIDRYVDLVD